MPMLCIFTWKFISFIIQGQPILEMVTSDCMHMFVWETNAVCTSNESPKVTTNCQFKINRMDYTYDLSALSKKSDSTTGYQVSSIHVTICFLVQCIQIMAVFTRIITFMANTSLFVGFRQTKKCSNLIVQWVLSMYIIINWFFQNDETFLLFSIQGKQMLPHRLIKYDQIL